MKALNSAESWGPPFDAPLKPSWSEGLKDAELADVRSQLRARQKSESMSRGPWKTPPCPESWLKNVDVIGVFVPRGDWDEPEQMPSFKSSIPVAYPSLSLQGLTFRVVDKKTLVENPKWRVLEAPPNQGRAVEPPLIFIPCLLADFSGNRIGRGGAFYDRYLQSHPNVFSVGLLHSDYIMKEIPPSWLHANDRSVSALMSQNKIFNFLKNGEK